MIAPGISTTIPAKIINETQTGVVVGFSDAEKLRCEVLKMYMTSY